MNSSDGARARMAYQEFGEFMKRASCMHRIIMPAVPTPPMARKTSMAVRKIRRICRPWPRAWDSEIMRLMATGRPVVATIRSTE